MNAAGETPKPPPPPFSADDTVVRAGLLFGLSAYALWGFFPLFLKALDHVSAAEILAHRIIWAVPFGALLIFARRQWPEVKRALATPRVMMLLLASALAITGNWLIYIWGVVNERILETALGYYINPLMYVALGVVVLGERLRRLQGIAVALAALGVTVMTIGAGAFPWVAVSVAALFCAYGYVRKIAPVGAMPGLFIETLMLSPLALAYLAWLMRAGRADFFSGSLTTDALLIAAGPVTVVPLLLFALAARRLPLTTLGFLQYLAPSFQFVIGLLFGEAFTLVHALSFGLIWTALVVFSFDAVRANRRPMQGDHSAVSPPVSASPKTP